MTDTLHVHNVDFFASKSSSALRITSYEGHQLQLIWYRPQGVVYVTANIEIDDFEFDAELESVHLYYHITDYYVDRNILGQRDIHEDDLAELESLIKELDNQMGEASGEISPLCLLA